MGHHSERYYSEIKSYKQRIYTAIWVNLKTIVLSDRSQTKKEYILYDLNYKTVTQAIVAEMVA